MTERKTTYLIHQMRMRSNYRRNGSGHRHYTPRQLGVLFVLRELVQGHGLSGMAAARFLHRKGKTFVGTFTEKTLKSFHGKRVRITIEEIE